MSKKSTLEIFVRKFCQRTSRPSRASSTIGRATRALRATRVLRATRAKRAKTSQKDALQSKNYMQNPIEGKKGEQKIAL